MNASILPKLSFEKNKKIMNIENTIMQIIIDSLLQNNSVRATILCCKFYSEAIGMYDGNDRSTW